MFSITNMINKKIKLTFLVNYLSGCLIFILFFLNTNNYLIGADKASPYSFLNNSVSVRAAGIGGAAVCFDYDCAGALINPALLSTPNKNNINVTFLKHLLDINSGNLMFVFNNSNTDNTNEEQFNKPLNQTNSSGVFAGSVVYTNYGTFDYYNELGQSTGGSFTGNMVSMNGTYANAIDDRFFGGITLKLIFNQLESMSGFAVAIDAGLLYKLDDGRTNFGFSILNAGTELKQFIPNYKSTIPLDIRLGFNHRLRGLPLNFNFGFNQLATEGKLITRFENVNIGGELYFGDNVQIRLGFDNYIRKRFSSGQNKGLTGSSCGVGIVTNVINVDYSISIFSPSLYLHRFGVNFKI